MLVQFRFRNFKSFRDDAVLDLSASNVTEFSRRVVSVGGERLLRIAAIYGANASGKSNVYQAFYYMSIYVTSSFLYGDDEEHFSRNKPTPFLFDSRSAEDDSEFEVYFVLRGDYEERIYQYGFCINRDGVAEEWLNQKNMMSNEYESIFYRNKKEETLDLSGLSESNSKNIEAALDQRVLIISLGAKLKVEICKTIRDWFLANEFSNFGNPTINFYLSKRSPKGFAEDETIQQRVIDYFSSFDDSIKGFQIEQRAVDEEAKDKRYRIETLHKKMDSDEMQKIPFNQESAGTLKMFALYPELQMVLERGSVLFIDELNDRLHPLLVRNFLLTFLNPKININNAQLVFTTHDAWQLSSGLLRRDEIWFTEKDGRGLSTLYSLVDIKGGDEAYDHEDVNYAENYLLGKYGAIPTLKKIEPLEEKCDGEKGSNECTSQTRAETTL